MTPQPHEERDDDGADRGASPTLLALRKSGHRAGKVLLARRELPRIPPAPDAVVEVRGAGPEKVVGFPPLLPQVRRLPQLVAQLRPVGVLRLPSHEARPGGEERLVDDLDAVPRRLALRRPRLPRRQKPRVDQLRQDRLRRDPIGKAESSSSRSSAVRVP